MENKKHNNDWQTLYEFVEQYSSNELVEQDYVNVINRFESSHETWRPCADYFYHEQNKTQDGAHYYGNAIVIYSIALCVCESGFLTLQKVQSLQQEIEQYCKNIQYRDTQKSSLWHNLGLCWHRLGKIHDQDAIEAFKKETFHILTAHNNISHSNLSCYSFRRIDKYLLESLVNEQLSFSSPTLFNDIFDCPIMELLSGYDDEVARLIRTAYSQCLKVACFARNKRLTYVDPAGNQVSDELKQKESPSEYLNELMWAHYADSHRGICIHYVFPAELTSAEKGQQVLFFKDIVYKKELNYLKEKETLNIEDSFFIKSSSWEYENELRLVYYNPHDTALHTSIPVPNAIAAIYFGVNCDKSDRDTIINLLHGRQYMKRYHVIESGRVVEKLESLPVRFYQMEKDKEMFGKIRGGEIKDYKL